MKRIILCCAIAFQFVISIMAGNEQRNDFPDVSIYEIAEDNDWVLLGETPLENCYQSNDIIIANLYVREIANNVVYRVGYQGKYYATRWSKESNSYIVTINGKTYKCDVPTNSAEKDTKNGDSAKFVGKWGERGGSNWLVEISYNGGTYHFKLNTSYDETISVISENSNEVIYTHEWKIDHLPVLNSHGLRCYSDDRNNDADPGYPTSGQYEYDRQIVQYTESISLKDSGPLLKGIKKHCFYYLQGHLVYANTNTDFYTHDFPITLIRY